MNPLPSYNNWLYDFCAVNPQRLISAGMISPFEIDEAVAETRRAEMELGFRGISSRPNPVNVAIGTIRIMSRSGTSSKRSPCRLASTKAWAHTCRKWEALRAERDAPPHRLPPRRANARGREVLWRDS